MNICRHFETNQDIKILPRQIYSRSPKVPFKKYNSKKSLIEFYIHPFKDFEPYAVVVVSQLTFPLCTRYKTISTRSDRVQDMSIDYRQHFSHMPWNYQVPKVNFLYACKFCLTLDVSYVIQLNASLRAVFHL